MKKILALVLALTMVFALAAPSAFADDGSSIAVCLASEPDTLDPALNSAVDGATLVSHLFSGLAKWAQDENGALVIVADAAEELVDGVVNDDGTVNASDAAQILIAAAKIGAGLPSDLTLRQWSVANVNFDSSVNATDAAQVLIYAAYIGAGGTTSPFDYFKVP